MKIDIKEIRDGNYDGQIVWICDFRFRDYSKKPIRKVEPTKVLVRSNEEVTKRIYYSNSHFIKLDEKGIPQKSKIIVPFDNTGYRIYPGIPINVFDNEKECNEYFIKQCEFNYLEISKQQIAAMGMYDKKMNDFNNLVEKYKKD